MARVPFQRTQVPFCTTVTWCSAQLHVGSLIYRRRSTIAAASIWTALTGSAGSFDDADAAEHPGKRGGIGGLRRDRAVRRRPFRTTPRTAISRARRIITVIAT